MAITTHVLDTSTGLPATGVSVVLDRRTTGDWTRLRSGVTNADGRCRDLTDDQVPIGVYRLVFATGEWFAASGRASFMPEVCLVFEVSDTRHHHVPLLLAPFGYSTYRGS